MQLHRSKSEQLLQGYANQKIRSAREENGRNKAIGVKKKNRKGFGGAMQSKIAAQRLQQENEIQRKVNDELEKMLTKERKIKDCDPVVVMEDFIDCIFSKIKSHKNKIDQSDRNKKIDKQKHASKIQRLIKILKTIIIVSEAQGVYILPHKALSIGELVNNVEVQLVKPDITDSQRLNVVEKVVIDYYETITFWEFKNQVSRLLGLSPKYAMIKLPNEKTLNESDHGTLMSELRWSFEDGEERVGLSSGDILKVSKVPYPERVFESNLIDYKTDDFVSEKLSEILVNVYDKFKNQETGYMDRNDVADYLTIVTNTKQMANAENNQVAGMMKKAGAEELIDFEMFKSFYAEKLQGSSKVVFKHLKQLNYRKDLRQLHEIHQEAMFQRTDMPRYTISNHKDKKEWFNLLYEMLKDCYPDQVKEHVWGLVQTLATNEDRYREVLGQVEGGLLSGPSIRDMFVKADSKFQQEYTRDIIKNLMSKTSEEDKKEASDQDKKQIDLIRLTEEPNDINDPFTNRTMTAAVTKAELDGNMEDKSFEDFRNSQDARKKRAELYLPEKIRKRDKERKEARDKKLKPNEERKDGEIEELKEGEINDDEILISMNLVVRLYSFKYHVTSDQKTDWMTKFKNNHGLEHIHDQAKLHTVGDITDDKETDEMIFWLPLLSDYIDELKGRNTQEIIQKAIDILRKAFQIGVFKIKRGGTILVQSCFGILMNGVRGNDQQFDNLLLDSSESSLLYQGLLNDAIRVRSAFKDKILKLIKDEKQEKIEKFFELVNNKIFDYYNDQEVKVKTKLKNSHEIIQFCQQLAREKAKISQRQKQKHLFQKGVVEQCVKNTIDLIQKQQKLASETSAPKTIQQEKEQQLACANREILMKDLIDLLQDLLYPIYEEGKDRNKGNQNDEKIQTVQRLEVATKIFTNFLFASNYLNKQDENVNEAFQDDSIIQQAESRAGDKATFSANSTKSRETAFALLAQIIESDKNQMKTIVDLLDKLDYVNNAPKTWGVTPNLIQTEYQKFLGLENLGNTCYINSIMQQLFMIPTFRYNLLTETHKDPLAHQVQLLFANLELSQSNEYHMKNFCDNYIQMNDEGFMAPTDPAIQKDAHQFLTEFFEQLGKGLKGSSRERLIQDTFGYRICEAKQCMNCKRLRNRVTEQTFLSVPIMNHNTLDSSLKEMVEGEEIPGFMCHHCKSDKGLKKREMIASAPNILIVQLKRFNFDPISGRSTKVNSYLEFPSKLNLKPYTYDECMTNDEKVTLVEQKGKDVDRLTELREKMSGTSENAGPMKQFEKEELNNLESDYDEMFNPKKDEIDDFNYKLVGITIHTGTAQAGHYWSYINTQRDCHPESKPIIPEDTETETWMEFEDSVVSSWNYKRHVKVGCYGQETGEFGQAETQGTSAYLLFYERVKKKPLLLKDTKSNPNSGLTKVAYDYEWAEDVVDEDDKKRRRAQLMSNQAEDVDVTDNALDKVYVEVPFHYRLDKREQISKQFFKRQNFYSTVLAENKTNALRADIYSKEFHNFIPILLQKVQDFQGAHHEEIHKKSLSVSKNVSFGIMARLKHRKCLADISRGIIQLLEANRRYQIKNFAKELVPARDRDDQQKQTEILKDLYINCKDNNNQKYLIEIVNYVLSCSKDDSFGIQDKAHPIRNFLSHVKDWLQTFQQKLNMTQLIIVQGLFKTLHDVIVYSPQHILQYLQCKNLDERAHFIDLSGSDSVAEIDLNQKFKSDQQKYLIAMKTKKDFRNVMDIYKEKDMVRILGHFILQDKTPISNDADFEDKVKLGYSSISLQKIEKVIHYIINYEFNTIGYNNNSLATIRKKFLGQDTTTREKSSALNQIREIIQRKQVLQRMIDPTDVINYRAKLDSTSEATKYSVDRDKRKKQQEQAVFDRRRDLIDGKHLQDQNEFLDSISKLALVYPKVGKIVCKAYINEFSEIEAIDHSTLALSSKHKFHNERKAPREEAKNENQAAAANNVNGDEEGKEPDENPEELKKYLEQQGQYLLTRLKRVDSLMMKIENYLYIKPESLGIKDITQQDKTERLQRIEQMLGFAQIRVHHDMSSEKLVFGLGKNPQRDDIHIKQIINQAAIHDMLYKFVSNCCYSKKFSQNERDTHRRDDDCLLGQLAQNVQKTYAVVMLRYILKWCSEDEVIAEFIWKSLSPWISEARYAHNFDLFYHKVNEGIQNSIEEYKDSHKCIRQLQHYRDELNKAYNNKKWRNRFAEWDKKNCKFHFDNFSRLYPFSRKEAESCQLKFHDLPMYISRSRLNDEKTIGDKKGDARDSWRDLVQLEVKFDAGVQNLDNIKVEMYKIRGLPQISMPDGRFNLKLKTIVAKRHFTDRDREIERKEETLMDYLEIGDGRGLDRRRAYNGFKDKIGEDGYVNDDKKKEKKLLQNDYDPEMYQEMMEEFEHMGGGGRHGLQRAAGRLIGGIVNNRPMDPAQQEAKRKELEKRKAENAEEQKKKQLHEAEFMKWDQPAKEGNVMMLIFSSTNRDNFKMRFRLKQGTVDDPNAEDLKNAYMPTQDMYFSMVGHNSEQRMGFIIEKKEPQKPWVPKNEQLWLKVLSSKVAQAEDCPSPSQPFMTEKEKADREEAERQRRMQDRFMSGIPGMRGGGGRHGGGY